MSFNSRFLEIVKRMSCYMVLAIPIPIQPFSFLLHSPKELNR